MSSESKETDRYARRRTDKADFRKVTITLPQDAYERLVNECSRRKIAGESNHLLSALMREALQSYLGSLDSQR